MMAYMDSGFKKITSITDRQAVEMNRCLEETKIPEWIAKRNKKTPWSKRFANRNRTHQLKTYNVHTDDVENTNSIN